MAIRRNPGRFASLAAALAVTALVTVAMFAPAAAADDRALAHGIGCSSFGSTWAHAYNAHAVLQGNPVRILSACCRPTQTVGVNHCFLTVTLAGTLDRGCETVNIGKNGLPSDIGRHAKCVAARQQTV